MESLEFAMTFKERLLDEPNKDGYRNLPVIIFLLQGEKPSIEVWTQNWENINRKKAPHSEIAFDLEIAAVMHKFQIIPEFGLNGYLCQDSPEQLLRWAADYGGSLLLNSYYDKELVTDEMIFDFLNRYSIAKLYQWQKDGTKLESQTDKEDVEITRVSQEYKLSLFDQMEMVSCVNFLKLSQKPINYDDLAKEIKQYST